LLVLRSVEKSISDPSILLFFSTYF
jgi:hypothetical protein